MKKTKEPIYALKASSRSLSDWYGYDAQEAMMEVTDAISPFMRNSETFRKFFYVHEFMRETDSTGEVRVRRIATNRIAGCPTFPQTKNQHFVPNDNAIDPGFIDFRLPESIQSMIGEWAETDIGIAAAKGLPIQGQYIDVPNGICSPEPDKRRILAALQLQDRDLTQIFGASALEIGSMITGLLKEEVIYYAPAKYMDFYHTYYVIETHTCSGTSATYEGFIYSNLLRGCPTFYPTKDGVRHLQMKQARLKENNGNMDIILPDSVVKKVRKITHKFDNASIL